MVFYANDRDKFRWAMTGLHQRRGQALSTGRFSDRFLFNCQPVSASQNAYPQSVISKLRKPYARRLNQLIWGLHQRRRRGASNAASSFKVQHHTCILFIYCKTALFRPKLLHFCVATRVVALPINTCTSHPPGYFCLARSPYFIGNYSI